MEIYKDIHGFEGLYQVSSYGNVKSIRVGVMRLFADRYFGISLQKEGQKKQFKSVHRLVAQAFIPNPKSLPQVNHKDGNRLNNHVSNLEWCTAKDNSKHSRETGLLIPQKGENASAAKLTEDEAIELLQLHKMYRLNHTKTAKEYGLCIATIGELLRRETWKHLEI